jgi:restriction system protein
MKKYYRVILGKQHKHFKECYDGKFIGVGWFSIDLKNDLPENWREFNKKFIPVFQERFPDKSKITAGLACGAIHTVSKGMNDDDIVLCPDGQRNYKIAKIKGKYFFNAEKPSIVHRRPVEWLPVTISRDEMSETLRNSAGSVGTISNISKHADEIENFIKGVSPVSISSTDKEIENPSMFVMENHLEDFLIKNWSKTPLSKKYDIYEDKDKDVDGRQFKTDTGEMDILAISKNKKEYLVIELKRGRASDSVVGQIQRYMGYIKEEFLEKDQTVRGVIIALEDDIKVKRALSVTSDIDFYQYKINFDLVKSD